MPIGLQVSTYPVSEAPHATLSGWDGELRVGHMAITIINHMLVNIDPEN